MYLKVYLILLLIWSAAILVFSFSYTRWKRSNSEKLSKILIVVETIMYICSFLMLWIGVYSLFI